MDELLKGLFLFWSFFGWSESGLSTQFISVQFFDALLIHVYTYLYNL